MGKQPRQVLLLLDNDPTHAVQTLDLTNVTVMFWPSNTTSHIQPMDAGIIAVFKKRYRSFQLSMALDCGKNDIVNIYKVDILQAMLWCRDSWNMVTPESIKNCWSHTGLLDAVKDFSVMELDTEENVLNESFEQLNAQPIDLDEYVSRDNDSEVHKKFTDADILATHFQNDSDTDEEDAIEVANQPRVLSLDQKINALQVSVEILNENAFDNFSEIKKPRCTLYKLCD